MFVTLSWKKRDIGKEAAYDKKNQKVVATLLSLFEQNKEIKVTDKNHSAVCCANGVDG